MRPIPGNNIRSAINLAQVMRQVIESGKITRSDEFFFLKAMTSETTLNDEELKLLNRVLDRMNMGLIRVEN